MEDFNTLESWENFFSLVISTVSEIQLKSETHSLIVTHSVYTKLVCCIDGILRLKENISILHVRQQHSIPEIEVIRKVLFVLSNMLNNLEEESLFWNAKMERLTPNIQEHMQSGNFVHFDLNGLPGRPKITIDVEQIQSLRTIGFTWVDISKMLGISRSTLYRRCAEMGLDDTRRHTEITDDELDNTIIRLKEVLPHVGERVIIGHLHQSSIYIQRERSGNQFIASIL